MVLARRRPTKRARTIDWPATARLLAARSQVPFAVVDGRGRIRLSSPAFDALLGWSSAEREGRARVTSCFAPNQREEVEHWLADARRGRARKREWVMASRRHTPPKVVMDATPLAHAAGILLTVVPSEDEMRQGPLPFVDHDYDYDYDVCYRKDTFGAVRNVRAFGGDAPKTFGRERCFEMFACRQKVCADCPVLAVADEPSPSVTVSLCRPHADMLELLTARAVDVNASIARVQVRRLPLSAAAAIKEAHLGELATRGKLTARERSVLHHLALGRGLDEIATALHISPRTVKFHQANVLTKLGADSRADLLRLFW